MSLFGVDWGELELEHVVEFLLEAGEEGLTWEAKGGDRPHPDSILKAGSGFANSDEELTALVVPMVAFAPEAGGNPDVPRILAAAIAGAVAFVTRSTLRTIGAGMVALWLLQLALGRIG